MGKRHFIWDDVNSSIPAFLVMSAALLAGPVRATTVTNSTHSGPGSLREAIAVAPPGQTLEVAGALTASADEVLALQKQAEAGDVPAQIALAEKLAASQRPADALMWYRKAAEKRHVEAYYRIGSMLLNGVSGPEGQDVSADPAAGVRWTYRAATNLHAKAILNMARSLERGLGAKTNLVEAYAWMQLFAERDPASGKTELTNLTKRLDAVTIREGQKLAKQLKDRQWSNLSIMKSAGLVSALKLEGVTTGGGNPLAVINRRTLAKGESAEVPVKGGSIRVKCLAIEEESVLVQVAGEDEPRLLRFDQGFAASGGR